jgi:hypothetical protein
MSTCLPDLSSVLPEVYQNIYGEEEWDVVVFCNGNERLNVLENLRLLSPSLGRPLRVLDLSWAQEFFSLPRVGAEVHDVDFLPALAPFSNRTRQLYDLSASTKLATQPTSSIESNVPWQENKVEELHSQIELLEKKLQTLEMELHGEALMRRFSFKYMKLQLHLLKQAGFYPRIKLIIKKSVWKLLHISYRSSLLRKVARNGLKKLGLYRFVVIIYTRLGLDMQQNKNLSMGTHMNQVNLLPSAVKKIFYDLTGEK